MKVRLLRGSTFLKIYSAPSKEPYFDSTYRTRANNGRSHLDIARNRLKDSFLCECFLSDTTSAKK